MRLRDWALLLGTAGVATVTYGALVEARNLVIERHTLALPLWPERLRGFKIALLSDFHIGSKVSIEMAQRAIALALDESPDMIVLAGDFVEDWRGSSVCQLTEALELLLLMQGNVVAVPGNHDYVGGDADLLRPVCEELNIKLLRNEIWHHLGINWVGIDSALGGSADPVWTVNKLESEPAIAIWHEPDLVGLLPRKCALQLSGHTHGGQFRFPGGFTPMHTELGKTYPRGFYPDAPTPIYVSRGVGTTLLPTRFLCPPEVGILTLVPVDIR